MGLLIKLVLFGLIAYFVFFVYRTVKSLRAPRESGDAVPLNKVEECPACNQRIRVPREQPGSCPRCGVNLGRGPGGKLLVKIN